VLAFGRRALSSGAGWREWIEIGVKLVLLAVAFAALSTG
jgi:hypothetical protein